MYAQPPKGGIPTGVPASRLDRWWAAGGRIRSDRWCLVVVSPMERALVVPDINCDRRTTKAQREIRDRTSARSRISQARRSASVFLAW